MSLRLLLAALAGWLDRRQQDAVAYLIEENRILRGHIRGRIRLTDAERRRLAVPGHRLGRRRLQDVATIVTPRHDSSMASAAHRAQMDVCDAAGRSSIGLSPSGVRRACAMKSCTGPIERTRRTPRPTVARVPPAPSSRRTTRFPRGRSFIACQPLIERRPPRLVIDRAGRHQGRMADGHPHRPQSAHAVSNGQATLSSPSVSSM
jgi:hypothetical protein